MKRSFSILWIGAHDTREFLPTARWLGELAEVTWLLTAAAAQERLAQGALPDLLILAQQRPGEIAWEHVEALRRAVPLVPIIGLHGAWCEGELRSGQCWSGMTRIYWHQATTRLRSIVEQARRGCSTRWLGPATSSEEERLLDTIRPRKSLAPALVAVCADSRDGAQWLLDSCAALGYSAARVGLESSPSLSGVSALVWNLEYRHREAAMLWPQLRAAFPHVSTLLLLDFPRADEVQHWLAAGVDRVASKPLLLDELATHLQGMSFSSPVVRAQAA